MWIRDKDGDLVNLEVAAGIHVHVFHEEKTYGVVVVMPSGNLDDDGYLYKLFVGDEPECRRYVERLAGVMDRSGISVHPTLQETALEAKYRDLLRAAGVAVEAWKVGDDVFGGIKLLEKAVDVVYEALRV